MFLLGDVDSGRNDTAFEQPLTIYQQPTPVSTSGFERSGRIPMAFDPVDQPFFLPAVGFRIKPTFHAGPQVGVQWCPRFGIFDNFGVYPTKYVVTEDQTIVFIPEYEEFRQAFHAARQQGLRAPGFLLGGDTFADIGPKADGGNSLAVVVMDWSCVVDAGNERAVGSRKPNLIAPMFAGPSPLDLLLEDPAVSSVDEVIDRPADDLFPRAAEYWCTSPD